MAATPAHHPVTLSATGNRTGPLSYHVCQGCQKRKPNTAYRVYPTGKLGKLCRKCRSDQVAEWKRTHNYERPDKNERPRRVANAPPIQMPPDHLEIDTDTCRRVMAAVLLQAIDQMREPRPEPRRTTQAVYSRDAVRQWCRTRAEAVIWLGSQKARPYFDAHGIDQEAALSRIGWAQYANAVLAEGYGTDEPLTRERRRVLEDGIEYFTGEQPCAKRAS